MGKILKGLFVLILLVIGLTIGTGVFLNLYPEYVETVESFGYTKYSHKAFDLMNEYLHYDIQYNKDLDTEKENTEKENTEKKISTKEMLNNFKKKQEKEKKITSLPNKKQEKKISIKNIKKLSNTVEGYKHKDQKGNNKNGSFSKAKKILEKTIYNNSGKTIYCGCNWNNKNVDLKSCGYKGQSVKMAKRAERVEWEHVVPAQNFGKSFSEWRIGNPKCISSNGVAFKGRKCAEKVNMEYRYMQADLYNLFPAIGEVNGRRNNYDMDVVILGKDFGECKFKINTKQRKVEPFGVSKGVVARTYLYMDSSYPNKGIVNKQKLKLYSSWDKKYPVTKEECRRAKKIERIQGNVNYILKERCAKYQN